MKKVSKETQERIANLFSELEEAAGDIECAVERYNTAVFELNEVRGEVAGLIQEYIDERSERWQESERGDLYTQWLDSWEEETEEVDVNCEYGDVDELFYDVDQLD